MLNYIQDYEKFLRVVRPPEAYPNLWKNGRPSSAAFKDKNGLSVNRTNDNELASLKCIDHLNGQIFSVTVFDCNANQILQKYLPTSDNIYHCELHQSEEKKELSPAQARYLARNCKLV